MCDPSSQVLAAECDPTVAHWARQYLGRPWVAGGRGPDVFDCWGLLRWVYLRHVGVALPAFPGLDVDDARAMARMIEDAMARGPWEELMVPEEYCGVAMAAGRRPHHVGVYTEADGGLIIHAANKRGVIATAPARLLTVGISSARYYRYHGLRH